MNSYKWRIFSMLAMTAGLAGACSSKDTTSHATPGGSGRPADDAGSATTMAGGDAGTAPCNLSTAAAAKAVSNLDAAYPGDDRCIAPPDPALGFQFHYGPLNYDDPAEVAKFVLAPGQEVTDCVAFPTPNTATVYFQEYHSRMRPGSHHMLLYLQDQMVPSGGPTTCNLAGMTQSRNLFGAQTAFTDVDSLAQGAPENEGMAVQIGPQKQAIMQAHFINAGTTPILREVWANVMYVDPSQVKILADPIFFIAGTSMNIPMGSTQVLHGTATVPANVDPAFRLIIGTGHYHAHTTRFTAYKTVNGQKDLLFEEYGTLHVAPEPKNWYFTSTAQNPTNVPASLISGGYSGVLYMKPGDTIDWECSVTNDDVASGLHFANEVYTGEMCNMFGLYAPSMGGPWQSYLNP
jgi:hypothetical protein